jgi:hypothetical protein
MVTKSAPGAEKVALGCRLCCVRVRRAGGCATAAPASVSAESEPTSSDRPQRTTTFILAAPPARCRARAGGENERPAGGGRMPRLRGEEVQREAAFGSIGSRRPLAPAAAPDASPILRGPTGAGCGVNAPYGFPHNPAPRRTHGTSDDGASGSFGRVRAGVGGPTPTARTRARPLLIRYQRPTGSSGHVLNDQHRWLVGVVVSDAYNSQRPASQRVVSPERQSGTTVERVGGLAG